MRRNSRTPLPPLFNIMRPAGARWNWNVTYHVASSGYVDRCHVTAHRDDDDGPLIGSAFCDVSIDDDIREVIECLAVESMLAACEPTLDGTTPTRRIQYQSVSSGF